MRYEWDEARRRSNLAKHGVDFAAMRNFEWGSALTEPADHENEERWTAIGFIGDVLYFAVYVERDDDLTRIISLRKARPRERRTYAGNG